MEIPVFFILGQPVLHTLCICVTLCNIQNIQKQKYLFLFNFGVLNMKMTLKIENWLWFASYGRDLIRGSYCSADEYRALGTKMMCNRIPRYILSATWSANIIEDSSFVVYPNGVVGVFLGARQLCYLFCMCIVHGKIHLSLSLCFRWDRNFPQVCEQFG